MPQRIKSTQKTSQRIDAETATSPIFGGHLLCIWMVIIHQQGGRTDALEIWLKALVTDVKKRKGFAVVAPAALCISFKCGT